MKKRVQILIVAIIGLGVLAYLIGSFSQATFNIGQWSQSARDVIAGCYALIASCIVIPLCLAVDI